MPNSYEVDGVGGGLFSESLADNIKAAQDELGDAKNKCDVAEGNLEAAIAEFLVGADPSKDPFAVFEELLDAMVRVMPKVVEYKEATLVKKTASYDYVSSLNNYMAETQDYFSKAGLKTPDMGSTSGSANPGLANGKEYRDNLIELRDYGNGGFELLDGLGEVGDILGEAITTTLDLESYRWFNANDGGNIKLEMPETLWSALNAPNGDNLLAEDKTRYENWYAMYPDAQAGTYGNDNTGEFRIGSLGTLTSNDTFPAFNDAIAQNTIMENTLNGYSKQTESEFKFEMDNYNSIVNLNGQMYSSYVSQRQASSTRLRSL